MTLRCHNFFLLFQIRCYQIVQEEERISIDGHENVVLKLCNKAALNKRFLFCEARIKISKLTSIESAHNLRFKSGTAGCKCSVLKWSWRLGSAKMTSLLWLWSWSFTLVATAPEPRARSMEFVFDSRVSFSNTGKRSTAVKRKKNKKFAQLINFTNSYRQSHCWRKRSGTILGVS